MLTKKIASGRGTCHNCKQKIQKGIESVRVEGFHHLSVYHVKCVLQVLTGKVA